MDDFLFFLGMLGMFLFKFLMSEGMLLMNLDKSLFFMSGMDGKNLIKLEFSFK